MNHTGSRVWDIAAWVICGAGVLFAAWLLLRYALGVFFPFLVGWGLAFLVRPLAIRVGRGTRIPNRILRVGFVLVATTLVALGIWLTGARLVRELQRLLARLTSGTPSPLSGLAGRLRALFPSLGEGAAKYIDDFVSNVVRSLSGALPSVLGALVSGVPRVAVALFVTLISAVYFCLDLERINVTLLSVMPGRLRARLILFKDGIFRVAGNYLRAYLILMCITFSLLLAGFLILRVEYALLLAFLVSLVDLLPVLGVGTVLVPWSIFSFSVGNPGRGMALLILWALALVVRQVAEPRVLGGSLGLHPLLALFSMYAGLRLAGLPGMLFGPAAGVLLAVGWRALSAVRPAATPDSSHAAPPCPDPGTPVKSGRRPVPGKHPPGE